MLVLCRLGISVSLCYSKTSNSDNNDKFLKPLNHICASSLSVSFLILILTLPTDIILIYYFERSELIFFMIYLNKWDYGISFRTQKTNTLWYGPTPLSQEGCSETFDPPFWSSKMERAKIGQHRWKQLVCVLCLLLICFLFIWVLGK